MRVVVLRKGNWSCSTRPLYPRGAEGGAETGAGGVLRKGSELCRKQLQTRFRAKTLRKYTFNRLVLRGVLGAGLRRVRELVMKGCC